MVVDAGLSSVEGYATPVGGAVKTVPPHADCLHQKHLRTCSRAELRVDAGASGCRE